MLHLAFPRADLPWLAPIALAGLFAAWMMVPPRLAALVGFLSGVTFFGLDFLWFGATAATLVGPYGVLLDLGPAAIEALAFALAGCITASAAQGLRAGWIPAVAAAGFTLAEMLRSAGVLGLPMYQIGAAFVDTPYAGLMALGGVSAATFGIAFLAATLAVCALAPHRANLMLLIGVTVGVHAAVFVAWAAWPARAAVPGSVRVAAVQGNLKQSVAWDAAAVSPAVERYAKLTRSVASFRPQFVLWPETVVTAFLQLDPATGAVPANAKIAASAHALRVKFGSIARDLHTVLAVGSSEYTPSGSFNALFFFGPDGGLESIYRKRRLVPFAEFLPGPPWLRRLPLAPLVSDLSSGAESQPLGPLGISPLICWDADFGDLLQRESARGAEFFAVATDDAWFGDSDGADAQAQIVQLRAIETGRWIVRAATTGISGIVRPDGSWSQRSALGTQSVITGTVGEPLPSAYSRIGPLAAGLAIAAIGILGCVAGRRRPV